MRKIKVEELTREAFAPFGAYYDFANPDGYALTGEIHRFYPDRLRERMVVRSIEYHTHFAEIVLPLNDDAVLHAAPASNGVPVTELAKAFLVPKNTMVQLNPGVWHLCALPVREQVLQALIVLPECTYANDCTVVELSDEQAFEIVF